MSVGDKLKADLNSAGPLVLISTYATKKNLIKKIYIYTLLNLLNKKSSQILQNSQKIGIAKNTFGVGEKWNVNTFS